MEVQGQIDQGNLSIKPPLIFKGKPLNNQKILTPLKLLIYGYNGIGKSTFASRSKNPVFMSYDGNIDHLQIQKARIKSYSDTNEFIEILLRTDHDLRTLVIDPLGELETLMWNYLNKTIPNSEKSHGKIYKHFEQEVQRFLEKLDLLRETRNMNIILIGHSAVTPSENPLTPYHERYSLRVQDEKRFGIPICNWVHGILLAVQDISFEEAQQSGVKEIERARTTARNVFYTRPSPAYLAKNTWNLPEKIPMDWNEFINGIRAFYSQGEQ